MPIYDYEDAETGVRISLRRPVGDRDKPIVLRRASTVPERLAIAGATAHPVLGRSFDEQIQRGYYDAECRGMRISGAEKRHAKRTWVL